MRQTEKTNEQSNLSLRLFKIWPVRMLLLASWLALAGRPHRSSSWQKRDYGKANGQETKEFNLQSPISNNLSLLNIARPAHLPGNQIAQNRTPSKCNISSLQPYFRNYEQTSNPQRVEQASRRSTWTRPSNKETCRHYHA
jgi:hypothetical protein